MYKLFVCGESSPNPEDWSAWSEYSIVIAKDEKEACEISGDMFATEIALEKPMLLVKMPEPNLGEDI
jgi:hypothetical protein